jgi:hypothetical protein
LGASCFLSDSLEKAIWNIPRTLLRRLKSGLAESSLVETVTSAYPEHTGPEQRPSVDIFCDCVLGSLVTIFVFQAWLLNASNWVAESRGLPTQDPYPVLVPLFMLTLFATALWILRKIVLARKVIVTDV